MSEPSLEMLTARAQAGDREALETLLRALQEPLFRLALRFLGDRENARDATQEILILVLTKLSTFRAESSIKTWAYRVACNHLLKAQREHRQVKFEQIAEHLAKPPHPIEPSTLQSADARLLEEEVFLGCTQAMLRALDRDERIAFVLGGICEVSSPDAAYALGITEPAFRKRLSRARAALDAFMSKLCGVANPDNPCRCRYQVNHRVAKGALDPKCLRYAQPTAQTSLEALRDARREINRVRRSLELYRAQPVERSPVDFAQHFHKMLHESGLRIFDA